jgi:hypothetical protein
MNISSISSNEADIIKVTLNERLYYRNEIMILTLLEGESQLIAVPP